nr:ribosome-associated protein YbcJ [Proteus mirabilis]
METFQLDGHPYVELCDLLKLQGWTERSRCKNIIAEGLVCVDGEVETRKRCKITAGKVVTLGEFAVTVSN